MQQLDEPAVGFWSRLAAVNLFLAVFNLIPAFPMDGGRVLRATLALSMDRTKATAIAARAGQSIAFLFGFMGLFSGHLLLLLIAVFVFMAAEAESCQSKILALDGISVLMKCLEHNSYVPEVQEAALGAFNQLATNR